MASRTDHTEQFLKNLHFFNGLPESDLKAFLAACTVKDYDKHAALFLQGDEATQFFIIHSGWIKLYRNTAEGDEALIAMFTRGDVFGEAAIFGDTQYPFSAAAAEQARLIGIPAAVLRARARDNPVIMMRVMESMNREMHRLALEKEHMTLMTAPQRVGCLLLQLSAGMSGEGGVFSFPFDKALAAARLGMQPETFSRALTQLKPLGVEVKGTEIRIDSFDCLTAFSCNHCTAELEHCEGAARRDCAACPGERTRTVSK